MQKKVPFWSDKYLELNVIQTQILIQYYKTLLQGMPVHGGFINKRLLIWAGLMFFYDHCLINWFIPNVVVFYEHLEKEGKVVPPVLGCPEANSIPLVLALQKLTDDITRCD